MVNRWKKKYYPTIRILSASIKKNIKLCFVSFFFYTLISDGNQSVNNTWFDCAHPFLTLIDPLDISESVNIAYYCMWLFIQSIYLLVGFLHLLFILHIFIAEKITNFAKYKKPTFP